MNRTPRLPRATQHDRLLRLISECHGPADAVALAESIGLHVSTVRFHLDALCEAGLLRRTRVNRAGVGRPRTGYLAVQQPVDYRQLAAVLATALGDSATEQLRRARHAGREWAAQLTPSPAATTSSHVPVPGESLDRAARATVELFDRMGFAPRLEDPAETEVTTTPCGPRGPRQVRTIGLGACPVRDLARTHPIVVCGVHLGVLQGLLDSAGTGAPRTTGRLEPFVEPERCVVKVITRG